MKTVGYHAKRSATSFKMCVYDFIVFF